jgi:hypothetical protein
MRPDRIAQALFIAALLAGSGASCQVSNSPASHSPKPTTHMPHAETNSIQQQAEALLRLSDDKYFSLTQPGILQLQESLADLYELVPGETGAGPDASVPKVLAIGMPGEIDKSEKKELPVLVGVMQSGQRHWEAEPFQNLWFVLREATSGKVMLSRPFLWDKRAAIPPPSKSGKPPADANAKATTAGVSRINVIKDLFPNSAWKPGHYYLTAVYYDWVSNSRKVELTNLDRKYEQAVPDLEARLQRFEKMGMPKPPDALPAGLSMSVEGAGCNVSIRLHDDEALFVTQSGAAYFLCTLLLFKLDANSPEKINLAIPVGTQSDNGQRSYQANCVLDLRKANTDLPLGGSYMAYLVSGPLLSGPHPIDIH